MPSPRAGHESQVVFLVVPHAHVLDLCGPVQVFHEANAFGGRYRLRYCAASRQVRTAQGLSLSRLEPPPEVGSGDLVLVPGLDSQRLAELQAPTSWLKGARDAGARVGSICTGAFALAQAGLLDGRRCTTHWKVADRLQRICPRAHVLRDRLFVRDGPVITSAGVASGIDMALALVEEDLGPAAVAKICREMVVYLRRNGQSGQSSVYLDHRTHIHPGIHWVQDWLAGHPESSAGVGDLAGVAGMSPRNLTRVFKRETGVTLTAYRQRLRMEVAGGLFDDPTMTVEGIASRCGYRDSRQLRRLWKIRLGTSPSEWRKREWRRSRA